MSKNTNIHRLVEYGKALHTAGAPTHVIEQRITAVLGRLGLDGSVIAAPTGLWLQVGDKARIVRLAPAGIDLAQLHDLALWEARKGRLKQLPSATDQWRPRTIRLASWLAAILPATWLGETIADPLVAWVGAELLLQIDRRLTGTDLQPMRLLALALAAATVAKLGTAVGGSEAAVALALVVLWLPGLGMTVAAAELATGNLASGSSRMWGVLHDAAQLAAGLTLGSHLVPTPPMLTAAGAMPIAADWIAPALAPWSFAVLLRAKREHVAPILLGSLAAFVVATTVGGWQGSAAAALTLGVIANAMSRIRQIPSLVLTLPGVLLLVPGSVGVRGVSLLGSDVVAGIATGVEALASAGALAPGLLLAHALLPGKNQLAKSRVRRGAA